MCSRGSMPCICKTVGSRARGKPTCCDHDDGGAPDSLERHSLGSCLVRASPEAPRPPRGPQDSSRPGDATERDQPGDTRPTVAPGGGARSGSPRVLAL